jgi:glyoxylase-like metal-dependent hydrolase (beta-lactamase superfamily II)
MRVSRILRAFALLCSCLALVGFPLWAQEGGARPGDPAIPPEKGYVVREIGGGLYSVGDGAYNTMFLVTREGVVAIDAPPTLGANYLKAIAEVTSQPVVCLVYSHEQNDHIGAANLFPKGVRIIAQRETAAILAERRDRRRPQPTIVFDDKYVLKLGGETLVLEYPGINHERGNIFIFAPRQKTLMLVDVVYPGYLPYKNMGIAEDLPGYLSAARKALTYDFSTLVAGHVTRLGTRADVELAIEFFEDARRTAAATLKTLDLGAFAKQYGSKAKDKWDLHNEYERAVVDRCYAELLPRWQDRLADTATYLRDNCWVMMENAIVTFPPDGTEP